MAKISRNRAATISMWFGIAGLFITVLIAYVERSTLSTYQKNLPYIRLGDNIKNKTTKAHLWFEELLAGDNTINYENDVLKLFKDSHTILQGVYDGKQTSLGHFTRPDEDTRELLKIAIIELEDLINITDQRWKGRSDNSGNAGSSLDEKFDSSYERVQAGMDKLMAHFNAGVEADSSYLNVLSWLSIVLVGSVVLVLTVIVYRVQRRNDKVTAESLRKLEEETNRMNQLSEFVEAVSKGDYSIQLSADEKDDLSKRLLVMRDTLLQNAEHDKRSNWATSGLAKIGDILRGSGGDTSKLYDEIIKFVVDYTGSNQGGLFLVNDSSDNQDEEYLEMVACQAFERKKFLTKRVDIGLGLIGQCFQEGLKIYLTEVPENYVNITSGLGGALPRSLLLVPMKVDDKVYGVIELASFRKFEDHEIELVEQFASSIAATVSNVRINESTRLLLEQTQQQAEEMRSQEEEMRQNMEELSATQEEMARKEREYINRIHELEARVGTSAN